MKNLNLTVAFFLITIIGSFIPAASLAQPARPQFSLEGNQVRVTADAGIDVYYTLDGTHPIESSTKLSAPVNALVPLPTTPNKVICVSGTPQPNFWDQQVSTTINTYGLESRGYTYVVTARMKATQSTEVALWPAYEGSAMRNQWGGTDAVMYLDSKKIATEWATYTWEFTTSEITYTNHGDQRELFVFDKIQFVFGNLDGSLYFDEVSVKVKDGSYERFPDLNCNNSASWTLANNTVQTLSVQDEYIIKAISRNPSTAKLSEEASLSVFANIDFSNEIVAKRNGGSVDGAIGTINLSGARWVKGYDNIAELANILRIGTGDGIVTLPANCYNGSNDIVTIAFDLWVSKLIGKVVGFRMEDTDNAIIGRYEIDAYYNNENGDFEGLKDYISCLGVDNNSICVESNRTHFVITLDYSRGIMRVNVTSSKGTNSVEKIISTPEPLKNFVVYSNYTNEGRRCWFDNLIITQTLGPSSTTDAQYKIRYMGPDLAEDATRYHYTPDYETNPKFDGSSEYYLFNIDAKAYFRGGNHHGTHASLKDNGYKVRISSTGVSTYSIEDFVVRSQYATINAWKKVFAENGTNIWVDFNDQVNGHEDSWQILPQGNGVFKIKNEAAHSGFLGLAKNRSGEWASDLNIADDAECTNWAFISAEEYKSIKTGITRTGQPGEYIIFRKDDIRSFIVAEDSHEFYYLSNDLDVNPTVNSDSSTVITLSYRIAEEFDYTLRAINSEGGAVLVNLASGRGKEGQTIFYPRAVKSGSKYYSTERNARDPYFGRTCVAGNNDVSYTQNNWVYYAEIEDMNLDGQNLRDEAFAPQRYSKGKAYLLNQDQYAYTDALHEGNYDFTLYVRNPRKTENISDVTLYIRSPRGKLFYAGTFNSWIPGECSEHTISGIHVPEGYSLLLKQNDGTRGNLELDYVYITNSENNNWHYELVTDINDIVSGSSYVIAGKDKEGNYHYMDTCNLSLKFFSSKTVAVTNDETIITSSNLREFKIIKNTNANVISFFNLSTDKYVEFNGTGNANTIESTNPTNQSLFALTYNSSNKNFTCKNKQYASYLRMKSDKGVYKFSAQVDENHDYDLYIFKKVKVAYPEEMSVSISSLKYTTAFFDFPTTVPTGVKTFKAVLHEDKAGFVEIQDTLPANTGALVFSETPGVYTFVETSTCPEVEGNYMVGTVESNYSAEQYERDNNVNLYALANKPEYGGVGFYRYNSANNRLAPYKAFFALPNTINASMLRIEFEEEEENTTGIEYNFDKEELPIYDLNGSFSSEDQNGLKIVNGKIVFKK